MTEGFLIRPSLGPITTEGLLIATKSNVWLALNEGAKRDIPVLAWFAAQLRRCDDVDLSGQRVDVMDELRG